MNRKNLRCKSTKISAKRPFVNNSVPEWVNIDGDLLKPGVAGKDIKRRKLEECQWLREPDKSFDSYFDDVLLIRENKQNRTDFAIDDWSSDESEDNGQASLAKLPNESSKKASASENQEVVKNFCSFSEEEAVVTKYSIDIEPKEPKKQLISYGNRCKLKKSKNLMKKWSNSQTETFFACAEQKLCSFQTELDSVIDSPESQSSIEENFDICDTFVPETETSLEIERINETFSQEEISNKNLVHEKKEVLNNVESNDQTEDSKKTAGMWANTLQKNLASPHRVLECTEEEDGHEASSAKKNRNKYLSDGLAERVQRLTTRKQSALRIWNHQLSSKAETAPFLTVEVKSVMNCFSNVVCSCVVPSSGPILSNLLVIFPKNLTKKLHGGHMCKIHPPWQRLQLCSGREVILCTEFTEFLNPVESIQTSQAPFECGLETYNTLPTTWYSWVCPCASGTLRKGEVCPVTSHPAATSLPSKFDAAVTCVGLEQRLHRELQTFNLPDAENNVPHHRNILEAIEKRLESSSCRVTFTASIERVCKRASLATESRPKPTYLLLVSDEAGCVFEVQLSAGLLMDPRWIRLSQADEGQCWQFTELKVIHRVNRSKHAMLFSVIDKIQLDTSLKKQKQGFSYILKVTESESSCQLVETSNRLQGSMPSLTVDASPLTQIKGEATSRRLSYLLIILGKLTKEFGNGFIVSDKDGYVISVRCEDTFFWEDFFEVGTSVLFRDLLLHNGRPAADGYTRCFQAPSLEAHQPRVVSPVTTASALFDIVNVEGTISYIDEQEAYTWQACNWCGSQQLQGGTALNPFLSCLDCKRAVATPSTHINLQVYLSLPLMGSTYIQMKLQEETAKTLLPTALSDPWEEGCEVDCVLGTTLTARPCIVTKARSYCQTQVFSGNVICVEELNIFS